MMDETDEFVFLLGLVVMGLYGLVLFLIGMAVGGLIF